MRVFILIILFTQIVLAQNSELFNTGLTQYNQKNYNAAASSFEKLIQSDEKDPAYVMLMMTYYARKEYVKVRQIFSDYMQNQPDNMYLDEAYYILGKSLFQLKEHQKAIEYWLLSLENTKNKDITQKVHKLITESLDNLNSEEDYNYFLSNTNGERSEAILSIKSAEFFEKNKKYSSAKNILNDFVSKYPNSTYNPVFLKRIENLSTKISNKLYIGVLLPLKSIPEVSNEIKSGIEFSIQEFEKKTDYQIELRIEDCGETVLEAIMAAKKLAEDKSIVAIVGPLNSDQTSAVSLIANQNNIPVISPTAYEYGIVDISKYIYQMYTDNFTLGKLIAEYAYGELKYRTFAVLSASTGKSYEVAMGFSETINRLGGEIVSHPQYLPEQSTNTSGQFRSIHSSGIKKMFRDSIETADPYITTRQVDSLYSERNKTIAEKMIATGINVDSNNIMVESIDAIFFPISVEDNERIAANIIANFAANKFNINIIGTDDWFDQELFSENKNYARAMDSMYVFSQFYIDEKSTVGKDFINSYRLSQKTTPSQFHFLGYRAAEFLFSALNEKNINRNALQLNLSNKDGLIVVGNQINFDHKERVNSGTTILQLRNGVFIKVN